MFAEPTVGARDGVEAFALSGTETLREDRKQLEESKP